MSKSDAFKNAIDRATNNREGAVMSAASNVQSILRATSESRLDPSRRNDYQATISNLEGIVAGFQGTTKAQATSIEAEATKLKTANSARTAGFIVLLVIALMMFAVSWKVALFLLIVALVANPIAKKTLTGRAETLAATAQEPANRALQALGRPAQGMHEATGLAGRADSLYLSSLDQNALMMEQQRRQMDAMRAQHNEQMAHQQAAMRQQHEMMSRMVEEQQATNDALYGEPGFVGSVLRARDNAKRNAAVR